MLTALAQNELIFSSQGVSMTHVIAIDKDNIIY